MTPNRNTMLNSNVKIYPKQTSIIITNQHPSPYLHLFMLYVVCFIECEIKIHVIKYKLHNNIHEWYCVSIHTIYRIKRM